MKSIKFLSFNLGIFAIFLGITAIQILQNDQQFFINNNNFLIIYISIIPIITLCTFLLAKIKSKILNKLLFIFFFQYLNLLLLKFLEYFFDDRLIIVLIISTTVFFLISLIDNEKIYTFISYLVVLFIFQASLIIINVTKINNFSDSNVSQKFQSTSPNIYFLIFDEISFDFISNNIFIDKKFENFKRFSENSTVFTNTHTSYDFTSKSSLSMLTGGQSIVNELTGQNDHYFKDINRYNDNLYNTLKNNYLINIISSYDYCYYHTKYTNTCISSVNKSNNIFIDLINFSNTFYNHSLPRFLINLLDAKGFIIKDNNIYSYINNEKSLSNYFLDNINNAIGSNNFYLFHSMISHQPWLFDEDGNMSKISDFKELIDNKEINELILKYTKSLIYTDKIFGRFIEKLKKESLYEKSIIILASDHGVSLEENNYLRMNGLANSAITKVPLMIKMPNQKENIVIKERFSLPNIYYLLEKINKNITNKKDLYSDLYNKLNEYRQFPFITLIEEYDLNGKINYVKNIYCNDQNGEYYMLNNENFTTDTHHFCVTN